MTLLTEQETLPCLAKLLIQDQLLSLNEALNAIQQARNDNVSLVTYLVKNTILSGINIQHLCATHLGFPLFNPSNYDMSALPKLVLPELVKRYRVIPLKMDQTLMVGMADPTDQTAINAIMFHTSLELCVVIISEDQIDSLIELYCYALPTSKYLELSLGNNENTEHPLQPHQDDEPLINFVDEIIKNALHKEASDIHIEPYKENCRIRFRIDGILYPMTVISNHLANRLITRLKVIAQLDISERRLPQDGHFHLLNPDKQPIDIRLSSCPVLNGEKIVLRILDGQKSSLNIDALGLTQHQKNIFLTHITRPQGLILVSGPTGSGKTMTLYSALEYLNTTEKNISTIENPVEIQLNGINQININPKIGLHFSTALRTLLRQDPDILMIGEIRDAETAEIAIQAAATGHLVFSTIHTNNAIDTLKRLQSMHISPLDLTNSLSLIISQRLVRKLCTACKRIDPNSQDILNSIGIKNRTTLFMPTGCHACLQGYAGRIGIYECLTTPTKPFMTLHEAAIEKVLQGLTSFAEINRVYPR